MFTYLTEYEDADGKLHLNDWWSSLRKAREHARRVSRKDGSLLVYVVACDETDGRVGAECYVSGRRDHVEGVVPPSTH